MLWSYLDISGILIWFITEHRLDWNQLKFRPLLFLRHTCRGPFFLWGLD